MGRRLVYYPLALVVLLSLSLLVPNQTSCAYDRYAYDNLQRSRDALLNQQADLQRAYDDTRKQIDVLNAKLTRLDSYLKQVNYSLRDVEEALKRIR